LVSTAIVNVTVTQATSRRLQGKLQYAHSI